MGVDLVRQTQVMLGAALLGVGLSFGFELVRVAGYFLKGAFWRFTLDALRVFAGGMAALLYFQRSADGQIRWYDLGAMLLSAWLFHFCIGRFLVTPLRRILSFLFLLLAKILRCLWYPFGKLLRFFTKIASAFFKKVFIFLKRYIIIKPYQLFLRRKKMKEASRGTKTEEKKQGSFSQFYH